MAFAELERSGDIVHPKLQATSKIFGWGIFPEQ